MALSELFAPATAKASAEYTVPAGTAVQFQLNSATQLSPTMGEVVSIEAKSHDNTYQRVGGLPDESGKTGILVDGGAADVVYRIRKRKTAFAIGVDRS
jgi:hypothetical protein